MNSIFGQILKTIIVTLLLANPNIIHAGNDPCNATSVDPSLTTYNYFSNVGLTDSGVEAPPYGGYTGSDLWISFIMPSSGYINLIINEGTLSDPAIAIYEGPCEDPKLLYNILDNNCDGSVSPTAVLDQLNPDQEYFIRVWAQNGSGDGNFSLFLSETMLDEPEFLLYADAFDIGDCIQLTTETTGQHGCAWFEIPTDFNEPFTHDMTVNFGDLDGSGADGICLIYQSNGPDYCGNSGGGIGALGLPNSAIFEFDTWQNSQYNDPAQDHAAFNINGDMNHNNSINGPVELGNIEDGLDHTIRFVYDGLGGYELYFDNVLLFSGVFDFINNCFGGSSTAWWGYTAATGSAYNNQIICPETQEFELGTQEYVEIVLCEGEEYNGYTEEGFYVEFVAGAGNCLHQINTSVIVNPAYDPTTITEIICFGEEFEINGEIYTQTGVYELARFTEFGCDSIVNLELFVPNLNVEIEIPDILDCNVTSFDLTLFFESDFPFDNIEYFWDTPSGFGYDEYFTATEPGGYYVTLYVEFGDVICEIEDYNYVDIDTISPTINSLEDVVLDCNDVNSINYINVNASGYDLTYFWYYQGQLISEEDYVEVIGEGIYTVNIIDGDNGCSTSGSAIVSYGLNYSNVDIQPDTLDCETLSFNLQTDFSENVDTFYWFFEGQLFSEEESPNISEPGLYKIKLVSTTGCVHFDSIMIYQDTITPFLNTNDIIIPCNQNEINISIQTDSINTIVWDGPQFIANNEINPIISEGGIYYMTVTNPYNSCTETDSIKVTKLGNSPELSLTASTINCRDSSSLIDLSCNQSEVEYNWYNNISNFGNNEDLTTYIPGKYYVEVTSENGCVSTDSIEVVEEKIFPEVYLTADTIDCDKFSVGVSSEIINGDNIEWLYPDGVINTNPNFNTKLPGIYQITVENQNTGCITTDSIEVIDQSNYPDFTLISDTLNCIKETVNLGFTISSSYNSLLWSFPSGNTSTEESPLVDEDGIYKLHIEVEGSCDVDTFVYIELDNQIPDVTIDYGIIDCYYPNTNIELDIKSEFENINIVSPKGYISNSSFLNVDEPGEYSIQVTGTNGCIYSKTIEIIAFLESPTAEIINDGPITCDHPNVVMELQNASSEINILWEGPDGFASTYDKLAINIGGQYNVNIINSHGCSNEYSVFIEEFTTPPNIEINGQDIDCFIEQSILTFNSTDAITNISWMDSNDNILSTNDSHTISNEGWYFIDVENEYGCHASDSIYIEVNNESPEISLLSDSPMIVKTNVFERESIIIDIESNSDYTIKWIPSKGLSCDDCPNPMVIGDEITNYTVQVINEFGCIDELDVEIEYRSELIVEIPNVFTPRNQDYLNDFFTLFGNENIEIIEEILIYNRWGELLFKKNNFEHNVPLEGWDGSFKNEFVNPGVFVYFFRIRTIYGDVLEYSGDVTVL